VRSLLSRVWPVRSEPSQAAPPVELARAIDQACYDVPDCQGRIPAAVPVSDPVRSLGQGTARVVDGAPLELDYSK
jgi:hypothetical protein